MPQPSISKIILNDYAAFLLTIGGPIALALSAFTAAFGFLPSVRKRGGQEVDPQFIIGISVAATILTAFLFYLLSRRVSRIKKVLANGPRATAKVTEIGFFKDRGRVEYEYIHNAQTHKTGTAIMKNKQTTAIDSGDEIEVAIDPGNPNWALIVQLYVA